MANFKAQRLLVKIVFIASALTACDGGTEFSSSLLVESSSAKRFESSSSQSSSNSSSPATASSTPSSLPLDRFDTDSPNHYDAPKAHVAPTIDGLVDDIWSIALWEAIDVPWREDPGVQKFKVPDSPTDFSGRYKAIWTDEFIYLLVDITDDVLNDATKDPHANFHQDDTVEIFIDEDNGREQYEGSTKAFAFHVSTLGDNLYSNQNLKDLVEVKISAEGNHYIWEMKIKVVGPSYNLYFDNGTDHRVDLYASKTLGFTVSYIDNDGGPTRESFIGSVNSELHQTNKGYVNSAAFGTLTLVE